MKLKRAIAAFTVLLFMISIVGYVYAETSIQHPALKVFGDVTKTVYVGRSIFEYKDDQGLSSVLPFSRQDKNITIQFSNIVFSKNFENKSVAKGEDTVYSELSLTKEVLVVEGCEEIYLKAENTSSLNANTGYQARTTLNVEKTITNDFYLLVTAKISKNAPNIVSWQAYVWFTLLDTGATTRHVQVFIAGESGTDKISNPNTNTVKYETFGHDAEYYTVQLKLDDILDKAGVSWNLVKLTKITYGILLLTGSTLDDSTVAEARFRHALLLPSKCYIDDGTSDGLVVNGTSGQFPPSAGDIVNIYGTNATKIVGVTIPWQVEVEPEIQTDPDNLRMQYTWEWTMPKSPSETGDTLTFSNTNITLYGYKDGDAWDKLYLNGVDKLSSIASKKVDETLGYWTYCLATSLTEGNMYQVIARIQYDAEEYDALTTEPLWWSNPLAWLGYKFWALVIGIAAFLGFGTSWALKQRRKYQVPKR